MFSKKKLGAHAHTKHPHKKKRQYSTRGILKFIAYLLAFFIIAGGFTGIIVYKKYIEPLPAASQLKNLEIAQSSTIYDKDGNELYKIFKEKRTYVDYEQININMVNAIVAGEDKRYWENPGIDVIGLFRAVFNYVTGKTTKLEGTSTISQQLIRNTIITNERKIERKIKEMYLSYAINKEFSKEKILELYLNKISF
ncbi:MAG: transglycosylase domain-containing protein [Candidatus Peribacteria bacterium]|nr:MAG: transglycosylase domain-containing protein [Candidatus Peribacteria bacterium]